MVACRFLLAQQSFLSPALPLNWVWVHRFVHVHVLCSTARLLFKLIGLEQLAKSPSCTVALVVFTGKKTARH